MRTERTLAPSMEPGHEDREYRVSNTTRLPCDAPSMEPGHEDREYRRAAGHRTRSRPPSMEPGHEDREYVGHRGRARPRGSPLNGARS